MDTNEGVVRYFNVMFSYVEAILAKGQNVMIHCLAGAHRAGTTGTAWILYKDNLSTKDAIKLAQSRRSAINPIGDYPELL